MSDSGQSQDNAARDGSPKIDKKIKNFSAILKARAKAEAAKSPTDQHSSSSGFAPISSSPSPGHRRKEDGTPRPGSAASTIRPDSVLSFRSELPNVKQSDFGAFRPESASLLPPDTVTTIRPDSVAAVQGQGQGVFRPFQAPSGPTARFNLQYQPSSDADWEAKDEMRQRELEEMRARAAQMEKTMRWWSDCTANWREKWSKVRNERNKTREDCRQLRSKLEVVVKECTGLKREKQDLIAQIDKLTSELELHSIRDPDKDSDSMSTGSNVSIKSQPDEFPADLDSETSRSRPQSALSVGMVEAKLKELTKMYSAEKEEKDAMKYKVEEYKLKISNLKTELSEMSATNKSLQDSLNNMKSSGTSPNPQQNMGDNSDRTQHQVETLRAQLERMQVENAAEWAKREQLSSEKHSLERENKKLKCLVDELQGEVRKKHTGLTNAKDHDIKSLQDDLVNRNKEYSELRQLYSKQKKQLQESSTELSHSNRRSEQYEQEVKKLRARIEELKDDLITAENEIDTQTNSVRKLQRTCEDLQETIENYQAQNAHLQSRLKVSGIPELSDCLTVPIISGEEDISSDEADEPVLGNY